MFLPSAPFRWKSVDNSPEAYFATGASFWTVVKALKAEGMSSLVNLRPTLKVGFFGSVVS